MPTSSPRKSRRRQPPRDRGSRVSDRSVQFWVTASDDGVAAVHHSQAAANRYASPLSAAGWQVVMFSWESPPWGVPPAGLEVQLRPGDFDEVLRGNDTPLVAALGTVMELVQEPARWYITVVSTGQTVVAPSGPEAFDAGGYWAARGDIAAIWRAPFDSSAPPVGAQTVLWGPERWVLPELAATVRALGHAVEDELGRRFVFLNGDQAPGMISGASTRWELVGLLVAANPAEVTL